MISGSGRGGRIMVVPLDESTCRCHVHAAPTPAAVAYAERRTKKYMRRTVWFIRRTAVAKRKVATHLLKCRDLFEAAAAASTCRPARHDALLHAAIVVAEAAADNADDAVWLECQAESNQPSAAGVCLRAARAAYRHERRFAKRAVAAAAALADLRRFANTAPLATADEIMRRRLAEGGGTTV